MKDTDQCSFLGWGQFLQSFCKSTSAYKSYHKWWSQEWYDILTWVIWHMQECLCKSFAKIVPIPICKKNSFAFYVFCFIFLHFVSLILYQLRFRLVITSKWLPDPQFCETWIYNWQKKCQKWSYNGHLLFSEYRTCAIISCSQFEATLIYKPRILSFNRVSWNASHSAA